MPRKMLGWTLATKILLLLCILCLILFITTVVLAVMLHNKIPQRSERLKLDYVKFKKQSERLPRYVVPKNYKLILWPDLDTNTFNGSVTIYIKVTKYTDKISFHASKQLYITKVTVRKQDILIALLYNVIADDGDLVTLHLPEFILPDYYHITVIYFGSLSTKNYGLYSTKLNHGKTMVTTFFQPTYARQAFPCFDEPEFKATFDITLVKPVSYIALSNMNEYMRSYDAATNTDIVTFAKSVPMSTYLLCFAICNFDYKETMINTNGIGNDFVMRYYAQKEHIHKLKFAQNLGKRALEFFIDFYKLPFPLPKLDMIAIPNFESAMEHWGLVSYNEHYFLFDEGMEGAAKKVFVASVIAHELAHMWFGNLVTMKWWDDLYLNEGFAQYMQYTCLSNIEPSWNMMDSFLPEVLHVALVRDAQEFSHPIVQDVQPSDNIMSNFDSITYDKASSIIRMLEAFIGTQNFRKGVNDYLKKFQFRNTVTQDLVDSLMLYFVNSDVSLNLTQILLSWTQQAGYPVLNVYPADEPYTYIVKQSRFLLNPEAFCEKNCKFGQRWFIPVTYTTNRGACQRIIWFSDTVNFVKITLNKSDEWLKLNNNQVGFYRVNYEADTWNRLIEELRSNSKVLTVSDRAHLINDVFSLASARLVSYSVALDLLTYLPLERHFVPWEAAYTALQDIDIRLKLSTGHYELKKFVQHLVKPIYSQLDWKIFNHTVSDRLFHTKILVLMTHFSLPEAMNKVSKIFREWLNGYGSYTIVKIDPEIRSHVFDFGAQTVTEEEWDQLWQIYLFEHNPQSKKELLKVLTSSTNTNLLRKFLYLSWDEQLVSENDFVEGLREISDNPSGTSLIWDYVRNNWRKLVERFTLRFPLKKTIRGVITACNTEVKLKEMEDFFAEYPLNGDDAIETCRINIKWNKHHVATVMQWLTDYLMLL